MLQRRNDVAIKGTIKIQSEAEIYITFTILQNSESRGQQLENFQPDDLLA